ncbi:MAG TPA: BON domain-containing protein [Thermodesulfobacteriota bacterium]|nr:BON domain-containing protein [Thermodesulfobacteriota bacterium]
MKRKWAFFILVAVLGVAVLSSCSTPAGRSAGQVTDDATITSKVKSELLLDDRVKGLAISVDTFEGNVTLTGGVPNQEQKDVAGRIARSVNGVKKVNNLITVRK